MKTKILFIILCLAMVIATISYASADQQQIANLGTFKQGECVNLLQTCANCTYVDITSVAYPNSTQSLGLTSMEKTDTLYNYTFCDTSDLGIYIVNGLGDLDGTINIFSYTFEVTPEGFTSTTSKSMTFTVLAIIFFISAVGLIIFGIASKKIPLTVFGVLLGIVFMIITYNILLVNPDLAGTKIHDMLATSYTGFIWVAITVILILVIILIFSVVNLLQARKKNNLRKWGLLIDDEE